MTTSIREPASQVSKAMTTHKMKRQGKIKTEQQLLPKEAFSPQITKFRRER